MIIIPSTHDIALIENLIPIDIIADKIIEGLKRTEKHARKSVITLTYSLAWDEDHLGIDLLCGVKAKGPVRTDRTEGWIGESFIVCHYSNDDSRQQRLPNDDSDHG